MSKIALFLAVLSSGCARLVVSATETAASSNPNSIAFLSIVADRDTAVADARLKRFLERAVAEDSTVTGQRPPRFDQRAMSYGDLIRALAEPEPGRGYVGRITPYAYVAAEMLGAKLSILAVYRSTATTKTTYRSYFVARRDSFVKRLGKASPGEPSLNDVVAYLKSFEPAPARFVYHDRFSTSSYFMPSLYFKSHDVVAANQSLNPRVTPIVVDRVASSSTSDLVREVKGGRADLAAVWDGTKRGFERDQELLFIPIPTDVPNDFLVASGIGDAKERRMLAALSADPAAGRPCSDLQPLASWLSSGPAATARQSCSNLGDGKPKDDFDSWHVWDGPDSIATDAAREALAQLRREARYKPTPVVVKVQGRPSGTDARADGLLATYVTAAKEAVRLSGTELVLLDPDLHTRVDMTWTLASTHDGALTLTNTLEGFKDSSEAYAVSFVDGTDLPRRLADLARLRLRRVRYVWPYELKYPAVLRDLEFTPDRRVLVQRIRWIDQTRNEYEEDTPFTAVIENNTDFSKFRLSNEIAFPKNPDGTFNFDPLSNVAYRVIIAREPQPARIWVVLASASIGLLGLACVGLLIDFRRRQPPPRGLQQTYQQIVDAYHRPWVGQQVEEGAILVCDARSMDAFVKELKTAGTLTDVLKSGGCDFNIGPIPIRMSVLMKLFSSLRKRGPQLSSELFESSGAGSVAALDTLLQFLVRCRRLSPFVGYPEGRTDAAGTVSWPLEWQALGDIATRHFQRLGICDQRPGPTLTCTGDALSGVVSTHLRSVLKRASRDASLFRQQWRVEASQLCFEAEIRPALRLASGQAPATKVRLVVVPPADTPFPVAADESPLAAWVLGRILNWTVEGGELVIRIKAIALLRDLAS
jgi:ABC-type phosphate/phosphonate transport system substrate-binding protein